MLQQSSLDPWYSGVLADLVATVVVFAASRLANNSSFYDAYWSVAPPLLTLYWAHGEGLPLRKTIFVALVVVWGARLTFNWARGWRSLSHEDWRYVDLRAKTGAAYWVVSLFGLHLFPTVMVLLQMFLWPGALRNSNPIVPLEVAGWAVATIGITLETVADQQLHRFGRPGEVLQDGLWAHSRHPNYLGEILFWVGCWLAAWATQPDGWLTGLGPLALLMMFRWISIPMIERRHLGRRPAYADYQKRVGMFWGRKT